MINIGGQLKDILWCLGKHKDFSDLKFESSVFWKTLWLTDDLRWLQEFLLCWRYRLEIDAIMARWRRLGSTLTDSVQRIQELMAKLMQFEVRLKRWFMFSRFVWTKQCVCSTRTSCLLLSARMTWRLWKSGWQMWMCFWMRSGPLWETLRLWRNS